LQIVGFAALKDTKGDEIIFLLINESSVEVPCREADVEKH
jgi:hypothetical protein